MFIIGFYRLVRVDFSISMGRNIIRLLKMFCMFIVKGFFFFCVGMGCKSKVKSIVIGSVIDWGVE